MTGIESLDADYISRSLSKYKDNDFSFQESFLSFLQNSESAIEMIKTSYLELTTLLKYTKLSFDEFNKLGKVIADIKRSLIYLKQLVIKNDSFIGILSDLAKKSSGLIENLPYVKNVESSWSGDYIYDIKKNTLCCINESVLRDILVIFDSILVFGKFSNEPNSSARMVVELKDFALLLGRLKGEYFPNVIYRRISGLMEEIVRKGNEIYLLYSPYRKFILYNYMENYVARAEQDLELLEKRAQKSKNSKTRPRWIYPGQKEGNQG